MSLVGGSRLSPKPPTTVCRPLVRRGRQTATAHTTDPSELQLIAVRIRGPLEPAEELAHHIPAGALRLLLRH